MRVEPPVEIVISIPRRGWRAENSTVGSCESSSAADSLAASAQISDLLLTGFWTAVALFFQKFDGLLHGEGPAHFWNL